MMEGIIESKDTWTKQFKNQGIKEPGKQWIKASKNQDIKELNNQEQNKAKQNIN